MENKNTALAWFNTKLILGLAIIVCTLIGAYTFYRIKSFDNNLTVTGSATENVTSDHVKWVGSISHIVKLADIKQGYAAMASDLAQVQAFLKANNISDDQIVIDPVFMNENYNQDGKTENTYTLTQSISVNSSDVESVGNVAKNINPLIEKGVMFSTGSLQYTYSKLPSERVSLLSAAIKDAKDRAQKLAESSGKSVGQLVNASSGVVQVMSQNSLDTSDEGSYDTSEVEKTVMLTVKASFTLN